MRIFISLLVIFALVAAVFLWLNRPVTVSISARLPRDFPDDQFSHRIYEQLLTRFVDTAGDVNYAAWHADAEAVAALDAYLAAVARFSPETAAERFATDDDALAYWMYAYNAYVMRSILLNWPIDSVTDVRAPIEAVKGLGFFYRNRYVFGGRAYSLLTVENQKIRKRYKDPRIHFVLNCGSDSCPVVRPQLPSGEALEALLAEAATDFVNDPANVSVDHAAREIHLSAIFKWYAKDFVNDLRARALPDERGVIDYIVTIADEPLASELDRASDYDIRYHEFDWSLNHSESS